VLALAAWLVGGDLFNNEVVDLDAQLATDAG